MFKVSQYPVALLASLFVDPMRLSLLSTSICFIDRVKLIVHSKVILYMEHDLCIANPKSLSLPKMEWKPSISMGDEHMRFVLTPRASRTAHKRVLLGDASTTGRAGQAAHARMSSGRRLPAAALSTLFFAMHAGAFRFGATAGVYACFV